MRNYLLAAVAAAALTTPAMARDNSVYVGVDAGVLLVEDTNLDFNYDYDAEFTFDVDDAITIDHKLGFDVDLVAGDDFGLVRGELELGYKRASVDEVQLHSDFIEFATGVPDTNPTEPFDADGDVSVYSAMANVLFDFGDEDGWSGFLGAGAGWAVVDYDVDVDGIGSMSDKVGAMETLQKKIGHSIFNITGIHVQVTLVEPRSIPRSEGKAKRVLDQRKM